MPQATQEGAGRNHPAEEDLVRFMRGELTPGKAAPIVRHLLAGCAQYRKVTRGLWSFGNEAPNVGGVGIPLPDGPAGGGVAVSAALKEAKVQLREIVRDLEAIRFRLLGVQESLPASPAETVRLAEVEIEEGDPATEIRTVIHCVLNDSLQPAIGDLRDVARSAAPDPPEGKG